MFLLVLNSWVRSRKQLLWQFVVNIIIAIYFTNVSRVKCRPHPAAGPKWYVEKPGNLAQSWLKSSLNTCVASYWSQRGAEGWAGHSVFSVLCHVWTVKFLHASELQVEAPILHWYKKKHLSLICVARRQPTQYLILIWHITFFPCQEIAWQLCIIHRSGQTGLSSGGHALRICGAAAVCSPSPSFKSARVEG